MCNIVSPRPVLPASHHHLRTLLLLLESWRNNIPASLIRYRVFEFVYWKRYLGHSSVNKKIFPILCYQLCVFLGESQTGFPLLFAQQRYFSPSFPSHVSLHRYQCSKLGYFSAEDSWKSSLLNCSVCITLSRLIFEHNWSKQTVVRFFVCLRSDSLFSHLFIQRSVFL